MLKVRLLPRASSQHRQLPHLLLGQFLLPLLGHSHPLHWLGAGLLPIASPGRRRPSLP